MRIVYPSLDPNFNNLLNPWFDEQLCMCKFGFETISLDQTLPEESIILRGDNNWISQVYLLPKFNFLNSVAQYNKIKFLSEHYHLIQEFTIPTFFTPHLDESILPKLKALGWSKIFVKKDSKSLFFLDDCPCIWPDFSFSEIMKRYEEYKIRGLYSIRPYLSPELFFEEERYFVLNDKVYHRYSKIPPMVNKVVKQLEFIGNRSYTIDVAGDFVVELNTGEAADRHGVNSLELFCSWYKDAFLSL